MRTATSLALCALALLASEGVARAQTLTKLTSQPPTPLQITFLLTDGTVLGQSAVRPRDWYSLSPDAGGNYAGGAWTNAASIPTPWGYAPSAFASAVLADGRLLIEGGEYNGGGGLALTNLGGLYDPVADAWTPLAPPPGWDYIGDSPSLVLPGGQFLIGRKLDEQVAMLDPATMQWTLMGSWGKSDFNSEEGWTLMPDGSVLTYDVLNAPNAEHYLPWLGMWLSGHRHGRRPALGARGSQDQVPGRLLLPPGRDGPRHPATRRHRLRHRLGQGQRARPHVDLHARPERHDARLVDARARLSRRGLGRGHERRPLAERQRARQRRRHGQPLRVRR